MKTSCFSLRIVIFSVGAFVVYSVYELSLPTSIAVSY